MAPGRQTLQLGLQGPSALFANIRLDRKSLSWTNDLAYFRPTLATKKRLTTLTEESKDKHSGLFVKIVSDVKRSVA